MVPVKVAPLKTKEKSRSPVAPGRRTEFNIQLNQLIDAILLVLSLWAAYALRYELAKLFESIPQVESANVYVWLLVLVIPFGPLLLELQGFYDYPLQKTIVISVRQAGLALLWLAILICGCAILKETTHAIALGTAIGMFFGFVPLWGFKTLLALGVARLVRGNLLATAIAATLHDIALPLMPLLLRWEYDIGYWLLSHPHELPPSLHLSHHSPAIWFRWSTFLTVGRPLLLGALVFAAPVSNRDVLHHPCSGRTVASKDDRAGNSESERPRKA
jgi:uncharacterized protein (DUF2062 family)